MCRSDDAIYRSTILPVVLKADQRSHDEKCVNWNEAAIRELLTIRAEAEIVRQFSEMVSGALYTSHEMSRVFMGSLRVVCERTHRFRKITGSDLKLTKIRPSRDKSRDTFSVYFPEWLCERGFSVITWVNHGKSVKKTCGHDSKRLIFFIVTLVLDCHRNCHGEGGIIISIILCKEFNLLF